MDVNNEKKKHSIVTSHEVVALQARVTGHTPILSHIQLTVSMAKVLVHTASVCGGICMKQYIHELVIMHMGGETNNKAVNILKWL